MPDDEIAREEEWRLVSQASPEEQRAVMAHMTRSYLELHPEQAPRRDSLEKALHDSETSTHISARRQRELDTHDRVMLRGSADAARDALHDNGPGKEPGAYTIYEARDRAAHTPPAHTLEPEK